MIDDVRLLYPGSPPDLCSPAMAALLREVTTAQSWVRWTLLVIGCGLALLVIWILLHGRLSTAGYIIAAILAAFAAGALLFWRGLRRDVEPYGSSAAVLCRYEVREGRIVKFGAWTSFGSSRSRYERVFWKLDAPPLAGRTPYARAILSAFLDLGDEVYIGIDPSGVLPPIFLGAKKPAPEVLTRRPAASAKEVYSALRSYMKTSRRWQGKQILTPFGADGP